MPQSRALLWLLLLNNCHGLLCYARSLRSTYEQPAAVRREAVRPQEVETHLVIADGFVSTLHIYGNALTQLALLITAVGCLFKTLHLPRSLRMRTQSTLIPQPYRCLRLTDTSDI